MKWILSQVGCQLPFPFAGSLLIPLSPPFSGHWLERSKLLSPRATELERCPMWGEDGVRSRPEQRAVGMPGTTAALWEELGTQGGMSSLQLCLPHIQKSRPLSELLLTWKAARRPHNFSVWPLRKSCYVAPWGTGACRGHRCLWPQPWHRTRQQLPERAEGDSGPEPMGSLLGAPRLCSCSDGSSGG